MKFLHTSWVPVRMGREKSNQELQGFVKESNSNSYFHDFEDNVPAPWKTTFYIMGVDYNQYVVLKGCLVGQNIPYTYAGFRMANPDEKALEAANKTLEEYDNSSGYRCDECMRCSGPKPS
ncbi:hypothetical protein ANN_18331 [Periplaneta americana]|uniref:Uncharacterized protein n=1 Tax=Periplaneta americana TaxID=6978 RepID=A0ABQ8SNH4_PERAM|nr:hypothetical protein ANN_18331 [Periplaneta americana]